MANLPSVHVLIYRELKKIGIDPNKWIDDWGVNSPGSSGKDKMPPVRGYFIYLGAVCSKKEVGPAVLVLSELFKKLYPIDFNSRGRPDNLRRTMIKTFSDGGRIPVCAFKRCTVKDLSNLEADHIKPYSQGGSGHHTNGAWLCIRHHRAVLGLTVENKRKMFDKRKL